MRILRVEIERWRNFRNVQIHVPDDATMVCLVGENGTGKSNVLELLASAASRFGISTGVELSRGDAFADEHAFSVLLSLKHDSDDVLQPGIDAAGPFAGQWDRTILLSSTRTGGSASTRLEAGGIAELGVRQTVAARVIGQLQQNREVHHLYLDADRAYPSLDINVHQLAEALTGDSQLIERLKDMAFRSSRTKYESWLRFMIGLEALSATRFFSSTRRSKRSGSPPPEMDDPFESYERSLRSVLPHLEFAGADTETRTLLYDSSGMPIVFARLSGGEREIAFLIGQIERFKLRRGLFLLDEPELHLNPSLVRAWVSFLRDTIDEGQVWIATHSLEAVEAAGSSATYVMERGAADRQVEGASVLSDRPVMAALSKALGTPAFSLIGRRFVLIEGDDRTSERERFFLFCGSDTSHRFVEVGTCEEVVRRLKWFTHLATETDEQLRVGGVIDRDFRTPDQVTDLTQRAPVYVLECHEVENFLLHPQALSCLLNRSERDPGEAGLILRQGADESAGMWIVQRAMTRSVDLFASLSSDQTRTLRQQANGLSWDHWDNQVESRSANIAALLPAASPDLQTSVSSSLAESARAYGVTRQGQDIWKECMGKQVLHSMHRRLGASSPDTLERQVVHLWKTGEVAIPDELIALRQYVGAL